MSKKKPKVAPVVSSEAKRKKLLAKQLKKLSLGGSSGQVDKKSKKAAGIHRKLSSDDSDDEDMDESKPSH